jgi:DNA protecting protein DprA
MTNQERAILQLLLTRGLGQKTLGRLLDTVAEEQFEVDELVKWSALELESQFGLKAEVAENISLVADAAEILANRLEDSGIRLLVKHRDCYPDRLTQILRESAPPVLFAAGNLELLSHEAVGFCGSRKSSDRGLSITKCLATDLASRGVNTVSGYAAGVDSAAHCAALESGGVTTLILAEGISHFRAKSGISELMTEENSLVLSEFSPDTRWAAHNAMQRNRTICALSKAVILIESGTDGGTFDAGKAAQTLGIPLFAIDYEDPPESADGNRYFLSRGAIGLRPRSSDDVDVEPVMSSFRNETIETHAKSDGWLFPEIVPAKKRRKTKRNVS